HSRHRYGGGSPRGLVVLECAAPERIPGLVDPLWDTTRLASHPLLPLIPLRGFRLHSENHKPIRAVELCFGGYADSSEPVRLDSCSLPPLSRPCRPARRVPRAVRLRLHDRAREPPTILCGERNLQ